jgi:hypothetical protein
VSDFRLPPVVVTTSSGLRSTCAAMSGHGRSAAATTSWPESTGRDSAPDAAGDRLSRCLSRRQRSPGDRKMPRWPSCSPRLPKTGSRQQCTSPRSTWRAREAPMPGRPCSANWRPSFPVTTHQRSPRLRARLASAVGCATPLAKVQNVRSARLPMGLRRLRRCRAHGHLVRQPARGRPLARDPGRARQGRVATGASRRSLRNRSWPVVCVPQLVWLH